MKFITLLALSATFIACKKEVVHNDYPPPQTNVITERSRVITFYDLLTEREIKEDSINNFISIIAFEPDTNRISYPGKPPIVFWRDTLNNGNCSIDIPYEFYENHVKSNSAGKLILEVEAYSSYALQARNGEYQFNYKANGTVRIGFQYSDKQETLPIPFVLRQLNKMLKEIPKFKYLSFTY